MPRPKVLPANRLRAPEACLACRASKKRCSGTFPCSKCIRNGRADSCVPFRRSNTSCTSAPRQTSNAYRAPTTPDAGRRSRNTSSARLGSLPQVIPAMSGTSGAPHKTHSRMLRDRKGEQGTASQDPAIRSGIAVLIGNFSLHWKSRFAVFPAASSRHCHAAYRAIAIFAQYHERRHA